MTAADLTAEQVVERLRVLHAAALDQGIEHHVPWAGWRRVQDQAVRVEVFRGFLVPDISTTPPPPPRQETEHE